MKIVAHVQIEIDDAGHVKMSSKGWNVVSPPAGRLNPSDIHQLALSFVAALDGEAGQPIATQMECVPLPQQPVAHANGAAPYVPAAGQAAKLAAVAALQRIGFDHDTAASEVTLHGPTRIAALAAWVEQRQKEGGVGNAKKLMLSVLRKKV